MTDLNFTPLDGNDPDDQETIEGNYVLPISIPTIKIVQETAAFDPDDYQLQAGLVHFRNASLAVKMFGTRWIEENMTECTDIVSAGPAFTQLSNILCKGAKGEDMSFIIIEQGRKSNTSDVDKRNNLVVSALKPNVNAIEANRRLVGGYVSVPTVSINIVRKEAGGIPNDVVAAIVGYDKTIRDFEESMYAEPGTKVRRTTHVPLFAFEDILNTEQINFLGQHVKRIKIVHGLNEKGQDN